MPDLLTVAEAAKRLQTSRRTVYRLIRAGKLKAHPEVRGRISQRALREFTEAGLAAREPVPAKPSIPEVICPELERRLQRLREGDQAGRKGGRSVPRSS